MGFAINDEKWTHFSVTFVIFLAHSVITGTPPPTINFALIRLCIIIPVLGAI